MISKRTNFRLNYNPYNLKKSIEQNYDNKQLKLIKNLALENQQKNIPHKNSNNIDKVIFEDEKGNKYLIF